MQGATGKAQMHPIQAHVANCGQERSQPAAARRNGCTLTGYSADAQTARYNVLESIAGTRGMLRAVNGRRTKKSFDEAEGCQNDTEKKKAPPRAGSAPEGANTKLVGAGIWLGQAGSAGRNT